MDKNELIGNWDMVKGKVKESFSFLSVISGGSVVDKFIADKLRLKEID